MCDDKDLLALTVLVQEGLKRLRWVGKRLLFDQCGSKATEIIDTSKNTKSKSLLIFISGEVIF